MSAAGDTANIPHLTEELRRKAAESHAGRASQTLTGGAGRALNQTLMALRTGSGLQEHASAGAATLYVLSGRIRLAAGDRSWEMGDGAFQVIPDERHSVDCLDAAIVLLTIAPQARDRAQEPAGDGP